MIKDITESNFEHDKYLSCILTSFSSMPIIVRSFYMFLGLVGFLVSSLSVIDELKHPLRLGYLRELFL